MWETSSYSTEKLDFLLSFTMELWLRVLLLRKRLQGCLDYYRDEVFDEA